MTVSTLSPASVAGSRRSFWEGVAAGLAAGALWGLVFVVPLATPGWSAVDVTAGRFVVFGVVSAVALFAVPRQRRWPTPRQALAALGLSVLGASGYYLLLVLAIERVGSELPTLIIGTLPLVLMLLGKPRGVRWWGVLPGWGMTALGLVGMALATPARALPEGGSAWLAGVLLAVAAMASWAVYAKVNAAWLARHPQVSATVWTSWLGVATGLGAGALWAVLGSDVEVLRNRSDWGWPVVAMLATGLGSAWLAGICWNLASQRLSVSLCGQLIVSETVFGLLYAFAWQQRWPSVWEAGAALLFTLGVLAGIRAHSPGAAVVQAERVLPT